MTRTSIASFAVGALAVGLVASGTAFAVMGPDDTRVVAPVSVNAASGATDDPTGDATGDPSAGSDPTPEPSGDDAVPTDDASLAAVDAALAARPGTVVEVERETENGRGVVRVTVVQDGGAAYEVDVDSTTGEVVRQRPTDSDDRGEHNDAATAIAVPAGVTVDKARSIALGVKAGTVREADLDDEDGRTVWDVEVRGTDGAKWEITIDAVTGDVLKTERD